MPVYFLHIPKTSGTSIHEMLVQNYGQKVSPYRLWDHLEPSILSHLRTYDVISGHFGIALTNLLDEDLATFTFLRHPIDRTLSHFMHVKRDVNHPYHEYTKNMKLANFLYDPITIPLVYNLQSRYLSFNLTGFDCKRSHCKSRSGSLSVTWEMMSYGMNDGDIRCLSLRSLDKLKFVGFVECFDESMLRVTELIDANKCHIYKANISPDTNYMGELTPIIRNRILDLNKIDMELYDVAKAIFWPKTDTGRWCERSHTGVRLAHVGE